MPSHHKLFVLNKLLQQRPCLQILEGFFLTEQETGDILCILKQECLHEFIFIQEIKVSRGEDILINHFPSENSPPSLLSLVIFLVIVLLYTVNNISFKIFLI